MPGKRKKKLIPDLALWLTAQIGGIWRGYLTVVKIFFLNCHLTAINSTSKIKTELAGILR